MTVTTDFSIKLESNPSVYIDGSVDRNDKLGEDCDWHYYDKNNFLQLGHPTISHDDVDGLKVQHKNKKPKYLISNSNTKKIAKKSVILFFNVTLKVYSTISTQQTDMV